MAKIKVEYLGELRTRAIHLPSGNELITDAPIDNKGKGEFFSPTDLTGTSLLTCMLTVMGILAREKQIAFTTISATVDKTMSSDPRRISKLAIEIQLKNEGQSDKEKTMLLHAAEGCPVAYSLHPEIIQELNILYV